MASLWGVGAWVDCRLQRLLAFYFQKKAANEEKAVVKSGDDGSVAPSTSAAPQSARSNSDQEQKYGGSLPPSSMQPNDVFLLYLAIACCSITRTCLRVPESILNPRPLSSSSYLISFGTATWRRWSR